MAGSKANGWENGLLLLLFNNTAYAGVGDAAGLLASAAPGHLYVSLHVTDPGEAGDQTTGEISYTDYARVGIDRASGAGGWTVTNNEVVPGAEIVFPISGGGTGGTVGFFGVGTAASAAGKLLYYGPVAPTYVVSTGATPKLTVATKITED